MFASVEDAAPWPQYAALTLPARRETGNEAKHAAAASQASDTVPNYADTSGGAVAAQRAPSETLTLEEEMKEGWTQCSWFIIEPDMNCAPD